MKKIYKVAMLSTPITIAIGSVGVYLAVSAKGSLINTRKSSSSSDFALSTENLYDHYKIFPDLHQETFYDDIKIKKGKAIIDDEMLSKIINYILKNMHTAQGDIGYAVNRIDNQHIIVSVKWNAPFKTYRHSYKIDLDQIISL